MIHCDIDRVFPGKVDGIQMLKLPAGQDLLACGLIDPVMNGIQELSLVIQDLVAGIFLCLDLLDLFPAVILPDPENRDSRTSGFPFCFGTDVCIDHAFPP